MTVTTYVRSFAALAALTALSFWLSYRHLGALGMPVALGIAAVPIVVMHPEAEASISGDRADIDLFVAGQDQH